MLCPTGCQLQETLVKQERPVRNRVNELSNDVDSLAQTSSVSFRQVTILREMWEKQQEQVKGRYPRVFHSILLNCHGMHDYEKINISGLA